ISVQGYFPAGEARLRYLRPGSYDVGHRLPRGHACPGWLAFVAARAGFDPAAPVLAKRARPREDPRRKRGQAVEIRQVAESSSVATAGLSEIADNALVGRSPE